jgi:exoribonuclease-2
MQISSADLRKRAHQAMVDFGFHPDFPPEIAAELAAQKPPATSDDSKNIKDMRGLIWSSIDNDNSRDLDQVEYAEQLANGSIRLMVGIADVDCNVKAGSATDKHAASVTTSVYTDMAVYPMLPDVLSTDRTSLMGNQERVAIIIEMHITETGEVDCHDVCHAWVKNYAKLAYSSVGAWLEGNGPIPAPVTLVPGMEQQLRLQLKASQLLGAFRTRSGALGFSSTEAAAVVTDGEVTGLKLMKHNLASDMIESFMIAANVSIAKFLKENHSLSIRRVVRTPKRWDRIQCVAAEFGVKLADIPDPKPLADFLAQRRAADPEHFAELSLSIVKMLGPGEYVMEEPGKEIEGHFGLAVKDYAHSTAPNRRFADLATQRLIKAIITTSPCPYTPEVLAAIAARCNDRENASRKVERLMRKVIAANLLANQVGQVFDGIITGASPKGTYVRLLKFPAEGMVVRGAKGLDVGDRVQVTLLSVDIPQGFVNFERK